MTRSHRNETQWMTGTQLANLLDVPLHVIYSFRGTQTPVNGRLIEVSGDGLFRAYDPPKPMPDFFDASLVFSPYLPKGIGSGMDRVPLDFVGSKSSDGIEEKPVSIKNLGKPWTYKRDFGSITYHHPSGATIRKVAASMHDYSGESYWCMYQDGFGPVWIDGSKHANYLVKAREILNSRKPIISEHPSKDRLQHFPCSPTPGPFLGPRTTLGPVCEPKGEFFMMVESKRLHSWLDHDDSPLNPDDSDD